MDPAPPCLQLWYCCKRDVLLLHTCCCALQDKQSPLSQDTQPLAELANQNQILQHQQLQQLHQPADAMDGHLWPAKPGLEQQFDQAYLLQSPGLSPMSMELTNDTLQQQAALGMVPFGASENDSFPLHPYAGGAAGLKDSTHNITDNVPGLSTLVEEDEEEVYNDSSADGSAMELTGNTEVQTQSKCLQSCHLLQTLRLSCTNNICNGRCASAHVRVQNPALQLPQAHATAAQCLQLIGALRCDNFTAAAPRSSSRVTRGSAAAASPAQPSPATATRSGGRRSSRHGTAAAASPAPSEPLTSPRTRRGSKRRSSAGAMSPAVPADGTAVMDMQTPPGEAQAGSEQQRGRPNLAPSMDPTPSPLRRITRSMASPLGSPLTGGFTEALEAGIAAAAAAAAGGDGGRSRRSTMNRFADQQNKWGFVPGEDDTMQMDLDMPGAWASCAAQWLSGMRQCCKAEPLYKCLRREIPASVYLSIALCSGIIVYLQLRQVLHRGVSFGSLEGALMFLCCCCLYALLQVLAAWARPHCTTCTRRAPALASSRLQCGRASCRTAHCQVSRLLQQQQQLAQLQAAWGRRQAGQESGVGLAWRAGSTAVAWPLR